MIHALLSIDDRAEVPAAGFGIHNARIGLKWSQADTIEGVVEAELGQGEDAVTAWAPLRDAYVGLRPLSLLGVKFGQFKRPFNRLQLRSLRNLQLIYRGISDRWIVEELRYGDRDLGLQLEGRWGDLIRLDYALGVFNGTGRNNNEDDRDGSKDLVGRVEVSPVAWISIGLDASYKRFDRSTHPLFPESAWMGGADLDLELEELSVLLAGMLGKNYRSLEDTESWSLLLLACYRLPLSSWWRLVLEPVAKVELLKPESVWRDAHIWAATAGANLHLGDYLRWMLQGEITRPTRNVDVGSAPDRDWEKQNRVLLQVALETR